MTTIGGNRDDLEIRAAEIIARGVDKLLQKRSVVILGIPQEEVHWEFSEACSTKEFRGKRYTFSWLMKCSSLWTIGRVTSNSLETVFSMHGPLAESCLLVTLILSLRTGVNAISVSTIAKVN